MFQRRSLLILGFALTVLLFSASASSVFAEETHVMTVNKKGVVTVSSPTLVGTQLLEPDEYKIYCDHTDNGQHQIVLIRMVNNHPYWSATIERESSDITKVSCKMETLPGKAGRTELHFRQNDSGQRYLTKVIIRGEKVQHIIG